MHFRGCFFPFFLDLFFRQAVLLEGDLIVDEQFCALLDFRRRAEGNELIRLFTFCGMLPFLCDAFRVGLEYRDLRYREK
jgi:hypothetical protein